MDNDLKLIKIVKQTVRKAKFMWTYRDLCLLSPEKGNENIRERITKKEPFAAIRGGATELRTVAEYLSGAPFSEKIKKEIFELSGVFPPTDDILKDFCEHYIACMKKADLLALWGVGAESIVAHSVKECEYTGLRALEPYYFNEPWSESLKGKKVLILHPFAKTIEKQYERRKNLFPEKEVLPEFQELITVQAVQSIAGEKTDFATWFEALHHMEKEIEKKDFDVAIIGAGAYGLPLAVHCKEIGKQAIQMAGATQLLFGIKGKRWDNHPVIGKFYNDFWVRPDEQETPKEKGKVEGGSYW